MESKNTNQQELNSQLNEAWKVLSPIAHFWLAFVVATGGLVIRLLLSQDNVFTNFKDWTMQGSIYFPIAAGLGTTLAYHLYTRIFGIKRISIFKIILFALFHYLLVSILAVTIPDILAYILPKSGQQSTTQSDTPIIVSIFFTYTFLLGHATSEFIVYATLFFASCFSSSLTSIKQPLSTKFNFKALILPLIVIIIMSIIANNIEPKTHAQVESDLRETFLTELVRVGHFLPLIDEISISNAVKIQEKKYGLKVTGKSSDMLIEKLREEPTKLSYTVGNKDADFNELEPVCDLISEWGKWQNIRKQMGQSESEILNFEIKIQPGYKVSKYQNCYVYGHKLNLVISSSDQNSPSTIHLVKEGGLYFSANEQSTLEIKWLRFEGDGSAQVIELSNNVTFKDNTVVMPKNTNWFGLNVLTNSKDVSVKNNQFSNAAVLLSTNANISDNSFSGAYAYIKTSGDGAPEIGTNFFEGTNTGLIWATENSHPNITGKLYLASPSKSSALYATDNAVINFKDGSIAAPNATGCLYADKSAKLIVENVNIGPCGQDYWPMYLDGKAIAEIRHSTFNTKREGMKSQFNKPLEDSVLVLEDNVVSN